MKEKRWTSCLNCNLKIILNLIRCVLNFVNMFFEFTLKLVILWCLMNLVNLLYLLQLLLLAIISGRISYSQMEIH